MVIEVSGLTKSYRGVEALKGVDLAVHEGEVFALLGPNGAGKTTTVEILEGHRLRSGGRVSVLGHDPGRAGPGFRESIGIVLQETGIERYLTVAEVIEQFRGFYRDPLPAEDLLAAVGLDHRRKARVGRLSGGERRRLDVAVALAGNPQLLFLDEPTTGFDPAARREAWNMLTSLQSLGTTIVLTTHYMEEAQALADRVAILANGRIVAEGTPSGLADGLRMATVVRFRLPAGSPPPPLAHQDAEGWSLATTAPTASLHELTSWACDRDIELEGLTVAPPDLEDVYLELTRSAP